ncbi:hypothetical protein [Nocardioides nitrophenolicus]|uniref:hypothetical protein n=1 Tax=Nocardioides nitrophenolicus TaxID=60489 RepID=UPI00195CDA38|nr:hypothetical protein [Nocardioides nitrophenolicus]MBM7517329.1 hypothetical protein [Nocardioides nitrophenolicus]
MSDLDKQLRDFVRDGEVPVPHVPDLVERVAAAQRRHQQRRHRAVGAALVACVAAGVGVAGVLALGPREAVDPDPASAPACGSVTVESASVSTADTDPAPARSLAILLDGPAARACPLGPGVRIEIGTGPTSVGTTIPAGAATVPLGVGQRAVLMLSWRNWCGGPAPVVRLRFVDGSAVETVLDDDTPSCADPATPTALEFVAAQTMDAQPGASEPPTAS